MPGQVSPPRGGVEAQTGNRHSGPESPSGPDPCRNPSLHQRNVYSRLNPYHLSPSGLSCGWPSLSKRPNFYSSAYFLETLFGCERGIIVEGVFGRQINMLICDGVFNLVVAQNDVSFFVLTGAAYRAAGTVVPSPDRFRHN